MTTAGLPGIGRQAAQQLARRELAKSIYQPSASRRLLDWLGRHLDRLFEAINSDLPGGWWALVALLILAVVIVSVVLVQVRPRASGRGTRSQPLAGQEMSASDHRELAESHAAAGDFAAAIVERVRAAAEELRERGVLPARPGRTADEFAAETSLTLPALRMQLANAARLFDDVRYGGRSGTKAGYQDVRDLDDAIHAARLPVAASAASSGAMSAGIGLGAVDGSPGAPS
ncbi:MAG: DUF4129 domain-containing protein [Streptosporangiaceae bacterium]